MEAAEHRQRQRANTNDITSPMPREQTINNFDETDPANNLSADDGRSNDKPNTPHVTSAAGMQNPTQPARAELTMRNQWRGLHSMDLSPELSDAGPRVFDLE